MPPARTLWVCIDRLLTRLLSRTSAIGRATLGGKVVWTGDCSASGVARGSPGAIVLTQTAADYEGYRSPRLDHLLLQPQRRDDNPYHGHHHDRLPLRRHGGGPGEDRHQRCHFTSPGASGTNSSLAGAEATPQNYNYDAIGSVVDLTDNLGGFADTYPYTAFGGVGERSGGAGSSRSLWGRSNIRDLTVLTRVYVQADSSARSAVHLHLIPRRRGDVEDPTGGVRNMIPGNGAYRH